VESPGDLLFGDKAGVAHGHKGVGQGHYRQQMVGGQRRTQLPVQLRGEQSVEHSFYTITSDIGAEFSLCTICIQSVKYIRIKPKPTHVKLNHQKLKIPKFVFLLYNEIQWASNFSIQTSKFLLEF
jgi:hypothetical protein